MQRDHFFITPIWRDKLNVNLQFLLEFIDSIKKYDPVGVIKESPNFYQSGNIKPRYYDELKDLEDIIEKRAFQISHESSFINYSRNLKLTNLRINIITGKTTTEISNDPGSALSGVFIVKSTSKSRNTFFYRDRNETFFIKGHDMDVEEKSIFNTAAAYPSVENGLIIYPSWLLHNVKEVEDDSAERISISFSLNFFNDKRSNNDPVL